MGNPHFSSGNLTDRWIEFGKKASFLFWNRIMDNDSQEEKDMKVLQLKNIRMSFAGDEVLKDVSMGIEAGEKIGLIGDNGAGKSTLLKIITGATIPESGEVIVGKNIEIGYLKQLDGLNPEKTIIEEMDGVFEEAVRIEKQLRQLEEQMAVPEILTDEKKLEKIMNSYAKKQEYFSLKGGYEKDYRIENVLNGMGFGNIPKNLRISKLSGGQKTRLAMAKILLEKPDILLLDEPTNHLDMDSLEWFENYMLKYDGTVIVVSHDRHLLDSVAGAIYEIERGVCRRYEGNYSDYVMRKSFNHANHEKKYKEQQKQIVKMQTFIDKNMARASTSKMAKSRQKALNRMEKIEKPPKDLKKVNMKFEYARKSYMEVLKVKNALISVYAENAKIDLISKLSFKIMRNDKIAIIGPNGSGKTTLLRTLIGENKLSEGSIEYGTDVEIGYYDQEHGNLTGENTVFEEMRNDFPEKDDTQIRTALGKFLFTEDDVQKRICDLSGGEKARVAMSKMMLRKVNFMILDEPTNHLDLKSKEMLEKALMKYDGTILFVSHDRYFIEKVAGKIMSINCHGEVAFHDMYGRAANG